jgi:hypothetical protein
VVTDHVTHLLVLIIQVLIIVVPFPLVLLVVVVVVVVAAAASVVPLTLLSSGESAINGEEVTDNDGENDAEDED